ncbi:MAG: adenylate/guanylate cyclase domain-containing protein [Verrucomicrobiota bacterium]
MAFLPTFSFRFKLLFAMMFIVVVVTWLTLSVTQKSVQATYQKLFETQFGSQIAVFNATQEARLTRAKTRCLELAQSIRLKAALAEGDNEQLYRVAEDELRDILPGGPLARVLPGRMTAAYFRLLDAQGREIQPPRGLQRINPKVTEQMVNFYGGLMQEAEAQQVGYVAPLADNRRATMFEVLFTKVVDAVERETLGGMVLLFRMDEFNERTMERFGQIKSGILVQEHFHTRTIPEAIHETLAKGVSARLKEKPETRGAYTMPIDGAPHLVFYQALNAGSRFPTAYQVCLYPLAEQARDIADLRIKVIGFGAFVLLCALIISLVITKNFSGPIHALVDGTNEIRKGNFAVKVPVRTRDEIGQLAASFNEMAEGLALKEKYHSVLNMVADKNVASELINGTVALGGETREISVLFCDIRGFTALTQGMDPKEVIEMLNEHMTALTRVVYEHDGVVDKFVGDLIMAVFGAPKSYGNDTYNAARCALRMIVEREKLNEIAKHRIQIGIGIASGPAVAGCMGSSDRLNYTVLGERVNLASRLCGVAGKMEVVIDDTTRERLGELVEVESMPELRLKGFSDTVRAWKLQEIHSLKEEGQTTG